jgi:spermidine/putrescine transport system ATP-binding protein
VTHDQEEALTMSDRIGVMSHGMLLQVGPPREIYNRPVNRFVADFIGETNFLPAVAQGGVLRLPSGELLGEGTGTGAVTVAIRPEQIRLTEAGEPGAISATVEGATYLGTDSHVHLRLADGTAVVARLQSNPSGDSALPPGTAVGLRPAPGAVQVLAD